ncbi:MULTISPECIES: hypothetical protein [unclassified Streptomyces]|uniref:hypothetical protein n=1 Tax=unclassified Streptomyces TaxID=2593676 RepID=UPI002E1DE76C|nr:hypothetical protein OG217_37625 [Streptomyces sp. NBC_01023]
MEAVRVVVLVLLGSAFWVAWRRSRYPGGWAFAFSARYAQERAGLAGARQEVRGAKKESSRLLAAARARERSESAGHEQGLRVLEQKVTALRTPGLGPRLQEPVGELVLHEHALLVSSRTGSIPLAGLTVRFESGRQTHSIYLTQPDGRVHRAKYPHLPPPVSVSADGAEDATKPFDEEQVRDFAVEIQNAVADEDVFRSHRKERLARAQEELAASKEDTASLDAAREHLSQVLDRQSRDPRRKAALAELKAASERWQALTGRPPPK